MALPRYVITVPAGTPATPAAGEPGTGDAAGYGSVAVSAGYAAFPQTFVPGRPIVLDSAGPLFVYLNGQSVLRACQHGQDDAGHAALSNLPARR